MIKNIFYILSILLILGGAYYSYDNRNKLIDQQEQTADVRQRRGKVEDNIKKTEDIRDGLLDDIDKTNKQIAEKEAEIESAKSKLNGLENTLDNLDSELRSIENELARYEELQIKVEEALAGAQISSIEEIPEKIEELNKESKDLEDELTNLEIIVERLDQKVIKEQDEKKLTDNRLATIKKRVANNDMVATITTVNAEWGFVIINAGSENSNIQSNTELVVRRAGQFLGKLKAAAVSPNQTICDLEDKGIISSIRAGDKVILKDPVVK